MAQRLLLRLRMRLGSLLVLTLLTSIAAAEPLSLQAALQEAGANNPELRAAAAEVTRAEGEQRSAEALFPSDPVLQGAYGTVAPFGGRERSLEVSISQELQIGGQRGLRLDATEAARRAAEARLAGARAALGGRVLGAFTEAWRASLRVELAQELAKTAEDLARAALRRVEAGDLSALGANVAQIEAARSRARVAATQAAERRARGELARLLGRMKPLHEPLAAPAPLEKRPLEEEGLIAAALTNRQDLKALRHTVESRRKSLQLAGRSWIPNPTVELGFIRDSDFLEQDEITGAPSVAGQLVASDLDRFLAVKLSIPLPLPARRQGATRQAEADLHEGEALLAQAEQAVAAQVREALAATSEAEGAVNALEAIVIQAKANVELSRRGFEAGELDLATFLAARSSAFDARAELIDAHAGAFAARAALLSALGEAP